MVEKVEILQHGEGYDLSCHPCEEVWWLFDIVAYHQMVVELGEDGLDPFSVTLVSP